MLVNAKEDFADWDSVVCSDGSSDDKVEDDKH